VAETQDLIAVHKPASMPVHACGQYRKNTVMALLQVERPDLGKLFPVHRLDKPVSGLLLIAKTAAAAKAVGTQIMVSFHSPGGMFTGTALALGCPCERHSFVAVVCQCKSKTIGTICLSLPPSHFWHDTALHMFPVSVGARRSAQNIHCPCSGGLS